MDLFGKQLAEEARRYTNLYDPASQSYKNAEAAMNTWKEIGQTLGREPVECMKKWKGMRDKFVRLKTRLNAMKGPLGPRATRVPEYYVTLSWLHDFVKHRGTESRLHERSDDGTPIITTEDHSLDNHCTAQSTEELTETRPLAPTQPFSCSIPLPPQQPALHNPDPIWSCSTLQHDYFENCSTVVSQFHSIADKYTVDGHTAASSPWKQVLDAQLPLSSLRLLVPPLWLMSACMWQVAEQRKIDQYGKLADFITLVTEMVPDRMSPKQSSQLIIGLRARFILELLQRTELFDSQVIDEHLNRIRLGTKLCLKEEVASSFDLSPLDLQMEQFISDTKALRELLQHQKWQQNLAKNQFCCMADTILSTLASKATKTAPVAGEDRVAHTTERSDAESQQKAKQSLIPKTEKEERAISEQELTLTMDVVHDKEEEAATDDSSSEAVGSTSLLEEEVLSPRTSSPCCEENGRAGRAPGSLSQDTVSHQPVTQVGSGKHRECSENMKVHLRSHNLRHSLNPCTQ
ncbi:uncharacterized protein LOC130110665 isoform X2 [Lampris incognitus]|uniref:uncharacterized protein LOC130110665 isoform X2 n=1 Tax=Lampris incognitus TaxID=2546036 RepID=UPI0024B53A95|nr:uncharacterized protein LOC130110665 isoform X2 [Lampris incognitus]